jgi:hypothetical protein
LPIAIPPFINSQLNTKAIFAFMITFAVMTPLGTFVSDYSPVLKPIHHPNHRCGYRESYFIFRTIIFESSEGHKFNIAKVSMIILDRAGVLL